MVHVHLLEVVPAVGEEPDAGFDALSERPAVTDVSQQEGDAAEGIADVDVRGVVLERLVVPEPLRLFVGVDVAAQPGQHGGVVDDLSFLLVHRQALGEMQRNVGLPEHVLGGVTQSKVGAEGQRGEELRDPYAGSFHDPIVSREVALSGGEVGGVRRSARAYHLASRTVGRHLVLRVKSISIQPEELAMTVTDLGSTSSDRLSTITAQLEAKRRLTRELRRRDETSARLAELDHITQLPQSPAQSVIGLDAASNAQRRYQILMQFHPHRVARVHSWASDPGVLAPLDSSEGSREAVVVSLEPYESPAELLANRTEFVAKARQA